MGMLRISKAAAALCAAGFTMMATAAAGESRSGQGPIDYPGGPIYGVYDPARDFRNDSYIGVESLFLPWHGGDPNWLRQVDAYAFDRGRTVMVTLEPFSWTATTQQRPKNLRRDILAGRYDATIDAFCGVVGSMRSPVWLRWGHEMESRSDRYPWAGWWPPNYIAAYRHIVARCRQSAPDAKYVWSPRGDADLADYFPGRDYVDIVGVSLYGLQSYQRLTGGSDQGFVENFRPVYDRLASFGLPIIIAELGYSGNADFVMKWSEEAMRPGRFPMLKAVVYFNARETADWPLGLGRPDWRVYANITSD
jgi:beta-mannanase